MFQNLLKKIQCQKIKNSPSGKSTSESGEVQSHSEKIEKSLKKKCEGNSKLPWK